MATIANRNRQGSPTAAMFGLLIGISLLGMLLFSASRHSEADGIRNRYRNKLCEGTELYFSPVRGTVLVLCGIPDSTQWGGLIYRVTENYGHIIIDSPYEVTVFSGTRTYWDNVLVRDGYMPLMLFPDVERAIQQLWR